MHITQPSSTRIFVRKAAIVWEQWKTRPQTLENADGLRLEDLCQIVHEVEARRMRSPKPKQSPFKTSVKRIFIKLETGS